LEEKKTRTNLSFLSGALQGRGGKNYTKMNKWVTRKKLRANSP